MVFVKIPRGEMGAERIPITFRVEGTRASGDVVSTSRESVFIGPNH